jgi:serine/threonine-protein kinase RsbW
MSPSGDPSAGPPPMELPMAAETANLPQLMRALQQAWEAAGLPEAASYVFELALEEFFMNVVMHGSSPGVVRGVGMRLEVLAGDVTLTLEDDGPAFDPLSLPAPDVRAGLYERGIGGYGVYLMRQLMDTVSYRRIGTHNQLRLMKHLPV